MLKRTVAGFIKKVSLLSKEEVQSLFDPRWIVGTGKDNKGNLGFRILGINFWYYKWSNPMIVSEDSYPWKVMAKREFGEVIQSQLEESIESESLNIVRGLLGV